MFAAPIASTEKAGMQETKKSAASRRSFVEPESLYYFLIKSINIVCRALRGSSVAQNYLDCYAVCAARFVNLPRSALVFSLLIEK